MEKYDHTQVEKKWQKKWEETQAFEASEKAKGEKSYLLIEFPYPSGDGLHVGHVRSWTAMDVVARKRRAQGENVLYPIGWDAFGLPAENYALKTGIHPSVSTKQNVDNFRRQIKSLGLSFDWSREINTTDPSYYKWTQWIFLQLYKKGLAYKDKTLINWCPKDKIGLANEEVVDGCCERCGTPVEKREKEQWMLAITKYAKRLWEDLDTVDYIERAKVGQRNWIGPSEGAEIDFAVANGTEKITVFTTRPDTLFGATYMVLSPEHPLVGELAERAENKKEVLAYVEAAKKKTDIERTAEGREKTGVELRGVKAINPANQEKIPIFVADYVLAGYGTGAIMAVPAHDERDFAFAKKFNLPVREVIEPLFVKQDGEDGVQEDKPMVEREAITAVVKHWSDDRYLVLKWNKVDWHTFITGGVEEGQTPEEAARSEIFEETGYKNIETVKELSKFHSKFFHVPKGVNRFAHFHTFYFELKDGEQEIVSEEEKTKHTLLWLTEEELKKVLTPPGHLYVWEELQHGSPVYTGGGLLVSSGRFDRLESGEAKKKITEAVGGKLVTTYKLRDWIFSRQRYWGEPIPMVFCPKCGWVPVPEKDLPVELPQVEKYQPTDTGESPLANITEWVNTACPSCGGKAKRETDVMPNWAGSSWYWLRYTDPNDDKEFASQKQLEFWTPVDWYNGGMEHTVLHLLYSRFWHKFLYDLKLVPTSEPYRKRTSHGLILAQGGEKMSKSKGNTVSPDDIVERYGADSLRLYEMFIGPFDQPVAWNMSAIAGVRRFLERAWRLGGQLRDNSSLRGDEREPTPARGIVASQLDQIIHQTIKKVSDDVENLKMNTAVAALMILLNEFERAKEVPREAYGIFLQLLSPFAPHLAHELAEKHGVDISAWPVYDESKIQHATVPVAVQVNGKVRGEVALAADAQREEALKAARESESIKKWLEKGPEVKAVYVPGKVINFVVRESTP